MSDVSDLRYELKLRRGSLSRWKKYLTEGADTGFRQRKFAERYFNKLEKEIGMLDEEIKRRGRGILWAVDLFKGTRRFVGNITKGLTEYLSPKKSKRHYLHLLLFASLFSIFLIFRNKGSVIGYTVIETVTSNYLSYFLVFILVASLVAFYKLNKK